MGAVYEASDLRLNRSIAVKILSGGLFGDAEALRRFQREAHASARLSHPNIVRVYDYGALNTEGAYLVMELLKGKTLGEILKKNLYLEPDVAAEYFDQVFSAIEAAHEAGIVHRDLKPDNIFIVDEPESAKKGLTNTDKKTVVKILDFGIAKLTQLDPSSENTGSSVTTPGAVLGTFGFMSPEQLMGGEIDQRSDIFSLGVIVVRALTGRRPFTGRTYQEIITAITTRPFQLPGSSPEVKRLDAVLRKCLAIDRNDRFASIEEMRRELIPAIRQGPAPAGDPSAASDSDLAATRKFDATQD
jgi:serine/threonine-protein kinase